MSTALSLFELAAQYRELKDLMETDELPPDVIRDTLEAVGGDLEAKAVNVAKVVLSLEAHAEAIQQAGKAMTERARRVQGRADSIRAYLLYQMNATETTKVTCPEFSMAVRSNPPAVVIRDDAEIPAEFMVVPEAPPPRVDKKALLAALKAGRQVDGCWIEQGQRLDIRL